MIHKKTPASEVHKKRGLFLSIGLFVGLVTVWSVLEWGVDESTTSKVDQEQKDSSLQMEQLQREACVSVEEKDTTTGKARALPSIVTESHQMVSELDIVIEEPVELEEIEEPPLPPENPITCVGIWGGVEQQPFPEGGFGEFYKSIKNELKYPEKAHRMNIEGRVIVQFAVDRKGRLTDFKVLKGIGFGCDREAIRVLRKAASWRPGKQHGRPVKTRMLIPIVFRLY